MKFEKSNKEYFEEYGRIMIIRSLFSTLMSVADRVIAAIFIGSSALVATTLISPLIFVTASIALLFISGMGAYVGLLLGQGKRDRVGSLVSGMMIIMLVIGFLLMLPSYLFTDKLVYLLGGRGEFLHLGIDYLKILALSFPLIMLSKSLDVLIVNDGSPKFSFWLNIVVTITNLIANIVSLSIFEMGVGGLALATLLSSLLHTLLALWYFLRRSKVIKFAKPGFNLSEIGRIVYNGLSDFALVATESMMVYVINIAFIKFLSPDYFEAYALVGILVNLFYSIYMGSAMGLQPLYSQMMGARVFEKLNPLLNYTVKKTSTYATISFLLLIPLVTIVLALFTKDIAVLEKAKILYMTYGFSVLLANYPLQVTYFFTAINRPIESMVVSLVRSLVLIPMLTYIFIGSFGVAGLALAYIVADILISIVVRIYMERLDYKSLKLV